MADLAEVLGEVPAQEAPEIPVETAEPKGATEEAPETPEPKAEKPVESPSTETQEPAMVPRAAMHAERERRQEAERQLDAYKKAEKQEQEKRPSVFDDEDAAFATVESKLAAGLTETLLNEGKGESIAKYGQELTDTAEQWFVEEAQKSPTLAAQLQGVPMLQQHRKVVELYKADQVRREMAEDPAALEERLKKQGVEEYLAAQKAKEDKKKALTDSIPKTLVGTESKGGIKTSEWSGPTPLKSVIGEGG